MLLGWKVKVCWKATSIYGEGFSAMASTGPWNRLTFMWPGVSEGAVGAAAEVVVPALVGDGSGAPYPCAEAKAGRKQAARANAYMVDFWEWCYYYWAPAEKDQD